MQMVEEAQVESSVADRNTLSLERLFRPRSVAILGASDKNPWGAIALGTLNDLGYSGAIHLINRRGTPALGRETLTSCADAPGGIDAAFVAVPVGLLIDALDDMAAGGIQYGAVVTSGLGETGAEGATLQAQVFEHARKLGITLLGPNSLGFTNFVDQVALGAMPMPAPPLPNGRLAVVSQSGATLVLISQAAHKQGVALSHMVAMGNEAMVDLADVIGFLVDDPATKTIAVFAETIRRPERFLEAARRAAAAKKPIVVLKVGTGELTAAVAQAHTGALVGDDRVFQAMCDAYNIARVKSLEDLVITADLLAGSGPIDSDKGFALISMSGGACEVVADRGEEVGIPFPQFGPATLEKLGGVLSDFGAAHNPLDVTGAAMAKPEIHTRMIEILGASGEFSFLGVTGELNDSEESSDIVKSKILRAIGEGLRTSPIKGAIIQQTLQPVTPYGRRQAKEAGVELVTGGIDHAVRAIGALYRWSAALQRGVPAPAQQRATTTRPGGEFETLRWLGERGVPVVPQAVVNSAEAAGRFADEHGGPVVLKILSPDIQHKTEVGGVVLNITGGEAAAKAYNEIMARVAAAKPQARIDGVIISPMRPQALEMIVGVARDPDWGLVLAVGLGGIWVEVMKDSALRLLPVTPSDVREALEGLRAVKLLTGYRGSKPVDLDALAKAVASIGDAALELGDKLAALEINPLRVDGDQVEALDALVVWTDG